LEAPGTLARRRRYDRRDGGLLLGAGRGAFAVAVHHIRGEELDTERRDGDLSTAHDDRSRRQRVEHLGRGHWLEAHGSLAGGVVKVCRGWSRCMVWTRGLWTSSR